jgi:hypothetical protein
MFCLRRYRCKYLDKSQQKNAEYNYSCPEKAFKNQLIEVKDQVFSDLLQISDLQLHNTLNFHRNRLAECLKTMSQSRKHTSQNQLSTS